MMLLATVIGYPDLGPALFVHLHRTTHKPSPPDWSSYLASLKPSAIENHAGGWANPADPHMSPATAQRWREMTSALRAVSTAAEAANIPLPTSLSSWARWVVPVGRLSFPTGRAVTTLVLHASSPTNHSH